MNLQTDTRGVPAGTPSTLTIAPPGPESPMRIAVTGSAGFLGSAVVAELMTRGHIPLSIDRDTGRDIQNPDLCAWIDGCDAVIHLAGVLGTAELFSVANQAVDINVKGALNVLQACKRCNASYVGISMPDCWANVYQATKYCARRLATAWHESFGLRVSHVRAFNAYGPGQKHGFGHPQKILPTFAVSAWQQKAIPIWGDGTQLVDLVHVNDVARMLVDAVRFGDDETFDAGTGRSFTVKHVAEMVIEITGSRAGIDYRPMRYGETPTSATCAKGEGWPLLDWRPMFNYERFTEAVVFYKSHQQALDCGLRPNLASLS